MKVRSLKPTDKVAEYVERILIIEYYEISTPFSLPLFANGSPTLLFISAKGIMGNSKAAHLTLFGQTILPETIAFPEGFVLIAYFFKPYSLPAIFGITALELTDNPIDLNLLVPKKTTELQERLLNAGTTEARIALLDHYISGLIANAKSDSSIIKYATNKIVHHPSSAVLTLVQNELYLTERTFQRMFEKNIGVPPRLYKRICQFNSAFQQLNNRRFTKLSDIAFDNGYADQSHYIRSFKEFTGLTPTDYLNFGAQS
jgi:AraC-like DNA-binding protein